MKHANVLRSSSKFVLATLAFLLLVEIGCVAQTANAFVAQLPSAGQKQNANEEAWEAQQKREAAKKENLKRERDIKKDTDKLLELATDLKQYVDKTDENTLSLDVIKKADQIEKLAHAVKEKMKGP